MLAAAAVLIPSGDDDFLQRLELEQTTPLDHIVADAKTVKKLRQEQGIADEQGISTGLFQLADQGIGTLDDLFSGFRLARIRRLSLSGGFSQPLLNRELLFGIREGANGNLIQKRLCMNFTGLQNLLAFRNIDRSATG